jgi:DHA1 family bicyclomycin/chloramphenicol resistance-like MFS transporter
MLTPGRRRLILTVLVGLVAFGPMTTDLYLPSLPTLVRVFETDVATVQLTLSIYMLAFALTQLVHGPLSDRFGRRPVILGGVGLYVVTSLACAFAPTIETLIAARFLQAVGACVGPVLGRAVVRDLWGAERSARVLALLSAAVAIAPTMAPTFGGVLEQAFGWRASFLFLGLFGSALLAASWAALAETNRHRDSTALQPLAMVANYRQLFGDRRYLAFVVAAGAGYGGIFAFISDSAHVMVGTLGLTPAWFGIFFGTPVLGYMAGTWVTGRTISRRPAAILIRWGGVIGATGSGTMMLLAWLGVLHVAAIILPVAIYLFAAGLVMPSAMAGAIGPYPRMAGLASALLGCTTFAFAALLGIGVGLMHDGTAIPIAAAQLTMSIVIFAVSFPLGQPAKRPGA